MTEVKLAHYRWERDAGNPVLPPDPASTYDCTACMTPIVVKRDDEYWLYYAGGDREGKRRVCLAIAPVARPTEFRRLGVVLDVGAPGAFDAHWMVTPRVHRFGAKWHMYYTALPTGWGQGLQSISGLGLATSDDGLHWTKYGNGPLITGDQTKEFPNNKGIGGGGVPVEVPQPDGAIQYRLYYSLAVGTPSADKTVDQEKHSAVCHSTDGIAWTDHRIVMRRRPEISREDCAANFPVVWRDGDLFRALHCAIGTRWGAYSIAEAVSADGYDWYRGEGGDDNLALAPTEDDGWEGEMVCYPTIVREEGRLRIYYNGNGYGKTGVGTATTRV